MIICAKNFVIFHDEKWKIAISPNEYLFVIHVKTRYTNLIENKNEKRYKTENIKPLIEKLTRADPITRNLKVSISTLTWPNGRQ